MDKELIELFKTTAAKDEEGIANRQAFAAELVLPVGAKIAAESTVRQLFYVDELELGAPASYPKDDGEINALVMPNRGGVPQNIVGGDELFVPTYEIVASAEWKLQYARSGRVGVAEKEVAKMKDAIVRRENSDGWTLIKGAVTAKNTVSNGDTSLTKALLNSVVKELNGKEGYRADIIVASPRRAADFRDWGANEIDKDTMKEIHSANSLGNIWGIDIMLDYNLTDTEIYVIDTSRMGVMPIRAAVDIQEDPSAIRFLRVRFIGFEEVGFAILDNEAIVKGVIS